MLLKACDIQFYRTLRSLKNQCPKSQLVPQGIAHPTAAEYDDQERCPVLCLWLLRQIGTCEHLGKFVNSLHERASTKTAQLIVNYNQYRQMYCVEMG